MIFVVKYNIMCNGINGWIYYTIYISDFILERNEHIYTFYIPEWNETNAQFQQLKEEKKKNLPK